MTPHNLMGPFAEMRLWHAGLFLALGGLWRWANKHVKYFKARLNGYTIEKRGPHA